MPHNIEIFGGPRFLEARCGRTVRTPSGPALHILNPVILPMISHLTNLIAQLPIQVVIGLTLLHETVVIVLTLLHEAVEACHLHCSKQAVN